MKPTVIFLFLQLIGISFVFAQGETSPAPFIYTPERIEQARTNAARYDWAATLLQDKLLLADEAAAQPPEYLRAWFTPTMVEAYSSVKRLEADNYNNATPEFMCERYARVY